MAAAAVSAFSAWLLSGCAACACTRTMPSRMENVTAEKVGPLECRPLGGLSGVEPSSVGSKDMARFGDDDMGMGDTKPVDT